MTYKEKASRFKELAYRENRNPDSLKWKDAEALDLYLREWGGRTKTDRKRRRGYLVSVLQDPLVDVGPILVAEVPVDFADKALAMGGFP